MLWTVPLLLRLLYINIFIYKVTFRYMSVMTTWQSSISFKRGKWHDKVSKLFQLVYKNIICPNKVTTTEKAINTILTMMSSALKSALITLHSKLLPISSVHIFLLNIPRQLSA